MNNIERHIIDHFENHFLKFKNRHGVEICMHTDHSFFGACNVPYFTYPIERFCISLSFSFDNVNRFVKAFSIIENSDLDKVTPELLSAFYEKGDAAIHCSMNDADSFGLTFRKVGAYLFATDHIKDYTHGVIPHLLTQEDFYNYTVEFYRTIFKKQSEEGQM